MRNPIAPWIMLAILAGCGGGGGTASDGGGNNFSGGNNGGIDQQVAAFNQALKWVDAPLGRAREIAPAALLISSVGSPAISEDARYVMFLSDDPTLVANDTNGGVDIFVRDTRDGVTYRRNVADIADQSVTNVTSYVTIPNFTNTSLIFFSVDNPENNPAGPRVFELDVAAPRFITRGQITGNDGPILGLETRPASNPTGPVRIRLYNRDIPEIDHTESDFILTDANADCLNPQFGGNRVFFYSEATNLVPNDNNGVGDIFAYDRTSKQVQLVSCLPNGVLLNAKSEIGMPSGDGRYYAFSSQANNAYAGDNATTKDVFVKDLSSGELRLISRPTPSVGGVSNGDSGNPTILPPFNGVIFSSNASNLLPNDTNNSADIFYWAPEPRGRVTSRLNLGLNVTEPQGGTGRLRQCVVNYSGAFCAYTTDADLGLGPGAGPVHLYRSLCVYPPE